MCGRGEVCNTGNPSLVGESPQPVTRKGQAGRSGVADRRVVPAKPGNAGGGKGPDFGHVVEGHKGRRVAQAYHLQVTKPRCSGSCLISRRSPCDVGLGVTSVGEPDAGDPHVRFEVAGAGNAIRGAGLRSRAKATEKPPDPKVGAPVLDPTFGACAPRPCGQPPFAVRSVRFVKPRTVRRHAVLMLPISPPMHCER